MKVNAGALLGLTRGSVLAVSTDEKIVGHVRIMQRAPVNDIAQLLGTFTIR